MSSPLVATTLAVLVILGAASVGAQEPDADARARRAAEAEARFQEELAAPRPIAAHASVWLEELTWMEVRDALRAGSTTAIVSTGGIEQNGPYLALGKHNYVLQLACEGIARALGDALCAPVIKLVPEGDIDVPSGHMRYPGTLSLRPETFEAVLTDVAKSLAAHGFETVVFIGDSGGNQRGMEAVAERLNAEWTGTRALFVPEFYRYAEVFEYMERELGIVEPTSDGLHDDFVITSIMMGLDPTTVRYEQRVAAGKASINGLSIEPVDEVVAVGRQLLQYRIDRTVEAIRAARDGGPRNDR